MIADLKAQLAKTQKEKDASRKQIEQQLTTSEAAKEAAEGKLKGATEELAQLKAAKEAAEAAAGQAKNDLETELVARGGGISRFAATSATQPKPLRNNRR